MPTCITPTTLAALLLFAPGATGHDLWLIPPDGATNKSLSVRAVSGSKFPKGDHAPDPAKFARRLIVNPDGDKSPLAAAGTDDTAGLLRFDTPSPGVYAIAVETSPKMIELGAAAFNDYLISDGLPHIFLLRSKEGTLDKPAKERYSKSPKAFLRVGSGGKGDPTKPVGLLLEIVPLKDPFAVKPGDALKVRVLFRGEPLAAANLGWDHPGSDGDQPAGTARTNGNGEALIPVAHTGLMTIRLTHMTRPKTAEYEWDSFWTTLTFRIPE